MPPWSCGYPYIISINMHFPLLGSHGWVAIGKLPSSSDCGWLMIRLASAVMNINHHSSKEGADRAFADDKKRICLNFGSSYLGKSHHYLAEIPFITCTQHLGSAMMSDTAERLSFDPLIKYIFCSWSSYRKILPDFSPSSLPIVCFDNSSSLRGCQLSPSTIFCERHYVVG